MIKHKIKNTKSFCTKCKKVVDAYVFEENGEIKITKICPEHSTQTFTHRFDFPEIYHFLLALEIKGKNPAGMRNSP